MRETRSTRRALLSLMLLALGSCAEPGGGRGALVVSTLVDEDRWFLTTRPELVYGKHQRMATSLYDFYRGAVPIFVADWEAGQASRTAFPALVLPRSTGDAHPENFGLLLGSDGELTLEPNDFDSADRYPYLWDVRRLIVGLSIGVRESNEGAGPQFEALNAARRDIVRAALEAYLGAIERAASGLPRPIFDATALAGRSQLIDDLLRRGLRDRDRRDELDELTEMIGGVQVLRRGILDPEEPTAQLQEIPDEAFAELPRTLEEYRRGLPSPPPAEHLRVIDAARQLGSGVASWPRIRVLVLVRGPSDEPGDDLVLELKELRDSSAVVWQLPARYADDVGSRVMEGAHALWSRPETGPLWGTAHWLGWPVQIRLESEAEKTVRTGRFVDEEGTVESIRGLAEITGEILGWMHASPLVEELGESADPAGSIRDAVGAEREAWITEQLMFAESYADQVARDHLLFQEALAADPTLGFVRDERWDVVSPELERLFGHVEVE